MNKFTKAIAAIMLMIAAIVVAGCNKPDEPNNGGNNNGGVNDGSDGTVMVATLEPNDITATTALCHAEITLSGGLTFNELGVCWSTHENPTINDEHLSTDTPGTGAFTCTITNLEPNTVYHIRAYALLDSVCYYGDDKSFITMDPGNYGGHDYVDLGLPSGTLWATCNVGANSPEEYGDYFAWGETEPKDDYSWVTYKWCNGDYNQLTKYCFDSEYGLNGFTDNLTILQSEDDAATVTWGEGWRMPDYGQWIELWANTTFSWTSQNGVVGCLLTSHNGKSLFLPAAGVMRSDHHKVDEWCCFWINWSHYNTICAINMCFGSEGCFGYGDGGQQKCFGFSVRPVRAKESGGSIGGNGSFNGHDYVDLGLPSGTLWATCNVGATVPENLGDGFAWGETVPKDHYGWDNYKYCNGSLDQLTKYCYNPEYGYNGFTDNLNTLQSDDDAATVNWGDGWVTPSMYQLMELFQYTTLTVDWDGCRFAASNGNSLYFADKRMGIWSSSLYWERPYMAITGEKDSEEINFGTHEDRCCGGRIRPVRSTN